MKCQGKEKKKKKVEKKKKKKKKQIKIDWKTKINKRK